jgi:hypothetical protein
MPGQEHKRLGKEKLQRIIEMCIAIENHTVDPFNLNVEEIISVVKEYFPDWTQADELNLDAQAIHHLATVIKMQSEWVKQRSTSLYADPFVLEEKIRKTSRNGMVDVFLGAWHPIVALEKLNLRTLADGLLYWEALAPLNERWKDFNVEQVATGTTSYADLVKARVLGDKEFSEELECYWRELKNHATEKGVDGKIDYWNFIGADTYQETVQRAFMVSFLVTYGFATLHIDRLEEITLIEPFDEPRTTAIRQQGASVPIAVSVDDWQKWKRGELN